MIKENKANISFGNIQRQNLLKDATEKLMLTKKSIQFLGLLSNLNDVTRKQTGTGTNGC